MERIAGCPNLRDMGRNKSKERICEAGAADSLRSFVAA